VDHTCLLLRRELSCAPTAAGQGPGGTGYCRHPRELAVPLAAPEVTPGTIEETSDHLLTDRDEQRPKQGDVRGPCARRRRPSGRAFDILGVKRKRGLDA